MEWLEQCKAIFKAEVDARFMMKERNRRSVNKIIRIMASNTKIPNPILREWYYGKENTTQPLCLKCGKHPILVLPETGKMLTKKSKSYGLCTGCRFKNHKEGKNER